MWLGFGFDGYAKRFAACGRLGGRGVFMPMMMLTMVVPAAGSMYVT